MTNNCGRVLVIGGGLAGLTAAHHLIKNGVNEVHILEASQRLGGRIKSVPHDGCVLEHGAQWIHGEGCNPILELAKQQDLVPDKLDLVHMNEETGWFYASNGEKIDPEFAESIVKMGDHVINIQASECYEKPDDPQFSGFKSLGEFSESKLEEYVKQVERSELEKSKIRGLYNWVHWKINLDSASNSLDDVSLRYFGMYEEYEGEQILPLKSGYDGILKPLLANIPKENIHLGSSVSKIKWNDLKNCNNNEPLVSVHMENGQVFSAPHVIVTCSLGYLKAHMDNMFEPKLPARKQAAIENIGFGTVNKIFLEFKDEFWSERCSAIRLAWLEQSEQHIKEKIGELNPSSDWWKGLRGFHALRGQKNMMCGWLTGKYAEKMEQVPEAEVAETCALVLKMFCGLTKKPEVTKITRTTWCSNPYTVGSYCYPHVNCTEEDFRVLQDPLPSPQDCRVLFAGEATDSSHFSTTSAAYISGEREAKRLLKHLKEVV